MSDNKLTAGRRRSRFLCLSAAAVVGTVTSLAQGKPADVPAPTPVTNQLFSWYQTGTPPPSNPQYIGAPFLSDANAAAVNAYFQGLAPGAIRAVKVTTPLSDATANLIFNNTSYHVSYVFGDLEGSSATSNVSNLIRQVRFQNAPGHKLTQSGQAFVGNFGFEAPFVPPASTSSRPNWHASMPHFGNPHTHLLTMSNVNAYPGSPVFPNPASGDVPSGGGTYPNIRSSLFLQPVERVSEATQRIEKLHLNAQNIPWTSNFNNYGNLGLDNNRDSTDGYKFVPGQPMVAKTVNGVSYPALTGAQTANQMLSEQDFAAMVAHMRMRGADSLSLLDSGIQGVSQQQMQNDAAAGWNGEFSMTAIFNQADHQLLLDQFAQNQKGNGKGKSQNLAQAASKQAASSNNNFGFGNDTVMVDGQPTTSDASGVIVSGVWSLSLGKLDVLLSNMDGNMNGNSADPSHQHLITLPSEIGGYSLAVQTFTLDGGSHWLVEYALNGNGKNKQWEIADQHVPFTAIESSRGGFGIPEPGTLSLVVLGGILGMNRRTRRKRKA